ncbi:MAG: hypothetical protein EAX95_14725 [Candidatus Thorarchaeota archaeon]|nr:hypothetical protein [Candidatus Thorarchaeota archaeon]
MMRGGFLEHSSSTLTTGDTSFTTWMRGSPFKCHMRRIISNGNQIAAMTRRIGDLYQCEECELLFTEEGWAKKCEEWCKRNKSCNIEIISHSVKKTELSL